MSLVSLSVLCSFQFLAVTRAAFSCTRLSLSSTQSASDRNWLCHHWCHSLLRSRLPPFSFITFSPAGEHLYPSHIQVDHRRIVCSQTYQLCRADPRLSRAYHFPSSSEKERAGSTPSSFQPHSLAASFRISLLNLACFLRANRVAISPLRRIFAIRLPSDSVQLNLSTHAPFHCRVNLSRFSNRFDQPLL